MPHTLSMPAPPHVYPGWVQSPQFIFSPHPLPTIPQYCPLAGVHVTHTDVSIIEASLPGSIPPGPVPPTEVPGPPDPPVEPPVAVPVPVAVLPPAPLRAAASSLVQAAESPTEIANSRSVETEPNRMVSPW